MARTARGSAVRAASLACLLAFASSCVNCLCPDGRGVFCNGYTSTSGCGGSGSGRINAGCGYYSVIFCCVCSSGLVATSDFGVCVPPSRSSTPTVAPTPSGTPAATPAVTPTSSGTPTATLTSSGTPAATPAVTPTRTRTPSPSRTRTRTRTRTPSPSPLAMCPPPVGNVTTLVGLSGVAPPVSLGAHGLFSTGSCARGLASIYASPRIVYFVNLGAGAARGGSLVVTTCGRTAADTLLYIGTGCPVGPMTFQCQVGNDNAGDAPGQAPCAGNPAASTATIAATTSRFYFIMLGHAPGSAPPVASVAWAYAPPAPTPSPSRTRTRKPKLLRR